MNIKMNGDFWHLNGNIGFTLKNVCDLGEEALAAIIKLRGVYDFLPIDPHCQNEERKRGYVVAIAIKEESGFNILKLTDFVHTQSENTEFSGLGRKLPPLPLLDQLWPELKTYIDSVLHFCGRQESVRPIQVKCHFLRLNATLEHSGRATPPEPHKDNAEQVAITLLSRMNVRGGENSLYDNQKNYIGTFTLDPLEVCFLDDRRFYHHVDDVHVEGENKIGYRDSLILEIKAL